MAIVIAILLAMILVAMVSSNKDAATGVMSFIQIALAASMMLAIWGIVLGYMYWAYLSEEEHGWFQIILTVGLAIAPPVIMYMARKDIVSEYKFSKKSFFKNSSCRVQKTFLFFFLPSRRGGDRRHDFQIKIFHCRTFLQVSTNYEA